MKSEKQALEHRKGWLKNGGIPCDLTTLPRCNATSKHTGCRCKQPAMKNGKCHWHGGKSTGAPRGNTNAVKHGLTTKEAKKFRKEVRAFIQACSETIDGSI
ncbi:HGGxSTG domain-containing protein [Desulfocastanea catecholica]